MSSGGPTPNRRDTLFHDVKGGEKYHKNDDRGSMSVAINDKGGYFLMVLSFMSKSIIDDHHEEAYGFT
jgi:hypothetical protein